MPRPLRINYPDAWYHVMNRGAGRQKIFKNYAHRMMFLNLLKECHQMFQIKICAYCLMDNHYHLLLSTPNANLPRVMRHINGVYTQLFNRSQKKDGALFRGRYKAKLIDEDCYQLIVSRYIHLNPIDAALVANPADYKWSSYPAYLGLAMTPDWLSKDIILNQLSNIKSLSHVKNYQDYVENTTIQEINVFRSTKFTKPIIGSVKFSEKILSQIDKSTIEASSTDYKLARIIPTPDVMMECICKFYNTNRKSLLHTKRGTLNWPRLVYIYLSRKYFGYSLRTITESLECSSTGNIGSSFRKCDLRLHNNLRLQNDINIIYCLIKSVILSTDASSA